MCMNNLIPVIFIIYDKDFYKFADLLINTYFTILTGFIKFAARSFTTVQYINVMWLTTVRSATVSPWEILLPEKHAAKLTASKFPVIILTII